MHKYLAPLLLALLSLAACAKKEPVKSTGQPNTSQKTEARGVALANQSDSPPACSQGEQMFYVSYLLRVNPEAGSVFICAPKGSEHTASGIRDVQRRIGTYEGYGTTRRVSIMTIIEVDN
jgi:hypothetical protein